MTETIIQALLDFKYFHNGGTSFNCGIYYLLGKADAENRKKLAQAFPVLYAVWREWYESPNEKLFWDKYQTILDKRWVL